MRREIITLCGSTRFMKEFKEVERALTFEGKIPLPPAIYGKAEHVEYSKELTKSLFELHLDKIRISDGIFVIDVGGMLGESTQKEIEFAEKNNKRIRYYSKELNHIKESLNNLRGSLK
ncbi:MAG: hypothetical protein WC916_07015 [Candidatus Woesearchaeota archaeon]